MSVYYEILDEREAKSILASKENAEPDKYRGIQNVYDYIVKKTDQDTLATEEKIKEEFADRYNIDEQLHFLIEGVKPPDYPAPLVHLHIFLKMQEGKLKPVIGFAASQLKGQIKNVCQRYNRVSVEELTKRAKAQQKNLFSSEKEHHKFLEDRIAKNEFYKTYALWFLEDDLNKINRFQSRIKEIIHTEVYPLLKSANDDVGGLYYRDVDESFLRYGLKPIVLFRDNKEMLTRYRYLVKQQLLTRIAKEYGDSNLITEAEALLDRIEEGYENTEQIAQMAKTLFSKITDKLGSQKPDPHSLQDLQICMELFLIKGPMHTIIQKELEKKVLALRKKLAQNIDVMRLDKQEESSPYILERLSARNDVYTADYPIKGELVRFFLAKENADPLISQLEKQVEAAHASKDKIAQQRKLDELQPKIEILEDMLGDRINFKSLRSAYVMARVSNLQKFFNWLKGLFAGKKGKLEETLWNKIRQETKKRSDKISKKKEAEKKKKVKKRSKPKVETAKENKKPPKEDQTPVDQTEATEEDNQNQVPEEVQKKLDKLASALDSMWISHLKTISLENYKPPSTKEVADVLDIPEDQVSVFMKKYTPEFKKRGIAYLNLRSTGEKVFITRHFFKKYARIITDIYDIIDQYEFQNPLRNEAGNRRMDFAHDLASYMHGKGVSEKKSSQLLKEYENVINGSMQRGQEVLSAARFIVKTAKNLEKGKSAFK